MFSSRNGSRSWGSENLCAAGGACEVGEGASFAKIVTQVFTTFWLQASAAAAAPATSAAEIPCLETSPDVSGDEPSIGVTRLMGDCSEEGSVGSESSKCKLSWRESKLTFRGEALGCKGISEAPRGCSTVGDVCRRSAGKPMGSTSAGEV